MYQCVQECLKNQYDWIEVAVTNNCSTDDTMDRLQSINDSRLHIYENEKNIGYYNYTTCLLNGRGTFCALLSDEDEFFDTDWELVRQQLESNPDSSVFGFKYFDEEGMALVSPDNGEMPANSYDTFNTVRGNCRFSGGFIIRNDKLHETWNIVDWKLIPHISFLYNYIISAMNCTISSDYIVIDNIYSRRTNRNNVGTLDTSAWCAGTEEPYWSVSSRKVQMEEWITYYNGLPINEQTKIKLSEDVIHNAIFSIRTFYGYLCEEEGKLDTPLFSKYRLLIERDRNRYTHRWIRESFKLYKTIGDFFNKVYGSKKRNCVREGYWLCRMVVSFVKAYVIYFAQGRATK